MEVNPGRWPSFRESRGPRFGDPEARERPRRGGMQGPMRRPRPVDDRHRNESGDAPPAVPEVEAGEIVAPHDPDEAKRRKAKGERRDRVDRQIRPERCLDAGHLEARVGHDLAGRRESRLERSKAIAVLERISRRHEQPQAVERETPQGQQRHMAMAFMRRIEAATVKADALAAAMRGKIWDHAMPARPHLSSGIVLRASGGMDACAVRPSRQKA
jgi:hypothetical protein